MADCKQISFTPGENGVMVPVFRHNTGHGWTTCTTSRIHAKPILGGTLGYAKWQAMFKAGYEVIEVEK